MTDYIDIYCERLEPGLLAEPLNFFTNAAFMIAALLIWPRVRGDRGAQVLCVSLFMIGVCSGLFHSFANGITSAADVISILVYILIYLFLANQRLFGWPTLWAAIGAAAFIPYSYGLVPLATSLFGSLNGSVAYLPVFIAIGAYAVFVRKSHPAVARGFAITLGLLAASLFFRTIDESICAAISIGTHFLWHILNGILLGWMILVIHRAQNQV